MPQLGELWRDVPNDEDAQGVGTEGLLERLGGDIACVLRFSEYTLDGVVFMGIRGGFTSFEVVE